MFYTHTEFKLSRFYLLIISVCLSTNFYAFSIAAQEQATAQEQTASSDETKSIKENTNTDKTDNAAESSTENRVIPAPVSLNEQQTSDINHYLTSSEIKPLLAGPNDFITLIKESTAANTKGVAILLADWQQTATNPKGLNFLRNSMPKQGWTTISIQPPSKPDNYPSQALKKSDRQAENLKTITDYQSQLSAIIETVMEKAHEYPGIFIVIAQGSHGAILTDLYQLGKNPPPNALILLSSYMYSEEENEHFATSIAQSSFPVLDLYLTRDHSLATKSAILRLSKTKQTMKAFYRQRQLTNLSSSYYPQESLKIAIKGWLTSIGW